jgi:hypothetical protein
MAKAFVTEQVSFNGQPMFTSQVGLNSSLVYNIEDGDVNARIFYKNPDGTVLNIIETPDTIGAILSGMNAVNTDDVVMISVYDTDGNLVMIPYESFMMVSEVNDGGSIITYVNGTTLATARVNNSVTSVVGMFNAAVGQYDSGQITIDTTTATTNQYVSAADNTYKNKAVGFYSSTVAYGGLTQGNIIWNPNPTTNPAAPNYGFDNTVYFKPSIPWTSISKITVYTNVTSAATTPDLFRILLAYEQAYYATGTTNFLYSDFLGSGSSGNPTTGTANQLLAGTPPTTPYTPNAGDAGTYYGELTYTTWSAVTFPGLSPIGVGDIFYGNGTYNIPTPTVCDQWVSSYIAFVFKTMNATPNLKFRFVIDYI